MAEQPHSTSRREIFGTVATAAIGVSLAIPASAASSSSAWDRARRAYSIADEAMHHYDSQYYRPASERHYAWRSQWPMNANMADVPAMNAGWAVQSAHYDPIEARYDALVDARDAAAAALIATPAPTIGAVAMKIDMMIDDERWDDNDVAEKMRHIATDLHRLGGH